MSDFLPAFTDEQLNSMSLQDEIQNMLVDEVRCAYAHIKKLEALKDYSDKFDQIYERYLEAAKELDV